MKRSHGPWTWASLVLLIIILLAYLFPLGYMIIRSLTIGEPDFSKGFPPMTLGNFKLVLEGAGFLRYAGNSLLVLLAVVTSNLVFSLMAGFAFARYRFVGRDLLFGLVLATLMLPKQVLVVPILDVMVHLGLHDTLWALILPFSVDSFNIFLIRQYLKNIPSDLEDAARTDGGGELRILWEVVFPLCKPILALVLVNTAITTWNAFLFPLVLTDTMAHRTLPIGLAIFSQGPSATDWGALMAGSVVSSLPIILLFLFFQKEIIAGITAGAIKE